MDILLDLWIHAVYNDVQVQGSDLGPVVYFRNHTGSPVTNYTELARTLGALPGNSLPYSQKTGFVDLLTLIPFTGSHGSIIYLNNYLSSMFSISDVLIDKEEVALALSPSHSGAG